MLLHFKITAVDFDGTLCEEKWPQIGEPNHEVINYIKGKKAAGEKIILWTCRSLNSLAEALIWCSEQGLEFDAVNDNIPEILEMFDAESRKIYYDELVDDKHCTKFKLPFKPAEKSYNLTEDSFDEYPDAELTDDFDNPMSFWAQREIDIACKRERAENDDPDGTEWDYGCACYESAYKAFKSMMGDGHSGFSINLTRHVLYRLIENKPLTPIEDTPDIWSQVIDRCEEDKYTCYQCLRMSSLFKYVYDDGRIEYKDVDNCVFFNLESPDIPWHNGLVRGIMNELFPIAMPYSPLSTPVKFYGEDCLTNKKNGDYDTVGILYAIKPDGERININRFYKECKDGFKRITLTEYALRKFRSRKGKVND